MKTPTWLITFILTAGGYYLLDGYAFERFGEPIENKWYIVGMAAVLTVIWENHIEDKKAYWKLVGFCVLAMIIVSVIFGGASAPF